MRIIPLRNCWPAIVASVLLVAIAHTLAADETDSTADASKAPLVRLTEEAIKLHRSAILVDGHNDLPWKMRTKGGSSFDEIDISQPQKSLHTDIERLRRGGVGAQFWAAYTPVSTIGQGNATRYTMEQIDLIHRMVRRYPDTFEMAYTADDIVRIHKQGKIASLIGIEGGHAIEDSLGVLRMFHALGVRYMTLTHADTLSWADSATDDPRHGGLSPFGEEIVRRMNQLGMLVDISHVSAETMKDVLTVSLAPVIASHSSAYAIARHPRNVPDDVLRMMAKNGGVIMVNFYSGFVVPDSARTMAQAIGVRKQLRLELQDDAAVKKAMDRWYEEHAIESGSLQMVVDHIDHIVKVAGVDHVGLGSDFDGINRTPSQLHDVSFFPYITQELLNRGYSHEAIRKILGENLLRAMRGAERVARGDD